MFSYVPDYEAIFNNYGDQECQIEDMDKCLLNEDTQYVKDNVIIYKYKQKECSLLGREDQPKWVQKANQIKLFGWSHESSFYHQVTEKDEGKKSHIFVPNEVLFEYIWSKVDANEEVMKIYTDIDIMRLA